MTSLKLFAPLILVLVSMNHPVVSSTVTTTTRQGYGMTAVKAEHLIYEWTINNFSLLPQEKGQYIESPLFRTENDYVRWKLRFYPQGYKNADYVSLYLRLEYLYESRTKVQFELSIIKTNEVKFKLPCNHTYARIESWGADEFIRRADLLNISGSDDTFIIRADVDMPMKIVTETLEPLEKELLRESEKARWTEHFGHLFKDPKFSDVVVVVSDQKFLAHKIILATRSPVFAEFFQAEGSKGNWSNEVKVEDMEPVVVKAMLEFIYTDEVTDLEPLASGLFEAADRFQLSRLKAMCEMVFYRTLNVTNAADLLILTDLHHSYKLKEHVQEFILKHVSAVIETEGFVKLEKIYMAELFRKVIHGNQEMMKAPSRKLASLLSKASLFSL